MLSPTPCPKGVLSLVQGCLCSEEGHPFLICTKLPLVPPTLCPRAVSAQRGTVPVSHRLCVGSGVP